MAIDANVLINERIREELRWARRRTPRSSGLRARLGDDPRLERDDADRGIALLIFAAARCAASRSSTARILTSMFSAVLVSRASST